MQTMITKGSCKNKALLTVVLTVCALLTLALTAQASPVINALSASGTGAYNNSPGLLIDHAATAEGATWMAATGVWWNGVTPQFTIDLGSVHTVDDLLVNVDNNDDYRVEYSTNMSSWSGLITISRTYGEIGWGMDTMTSIAGNPEYVTGIDFAPVKARYLRIFATGGDNMYAVSEVEAHGNTVPVPAAAYLLGSGLVGLLGFRKRVRS